MSVKTICYVIFLILSYTFAISVNNLKDLKLNNEKIVEVKNLELSQLATELKTEIINYPNFCPFEVRNRDDPFYIYKINAHGLGCSPEKVYIENYEKTIKTFSSECFGFFPGEGELNQDIPECGGDIQCLHKHLNTFMKQDSYIKKDLSGKEIPLTCDPGCWVIAEKFDDIGTVDQRHTRYSDFTDPWLINIWPNETDMKLLDWDFNSPPDDGVNEEFVLTVGYKSETLYEWVAYYFAPNQQAYYGSLMSPIDSTEGKVKRVTLWRRKHGFCKFT